MLNSIYITTIKRKVASIRSKTSSYYIVFVGITRDTYLNKLEL